MSKGLFFNLPVSSSQLSPSQLFGHFGQSEMFLYNCIVVHNLQTLNQEISTPIKRYLLPKSYAREVGYGLTSITKSINKGWLEISEFPSIEGEFIDIQAYPPEKYFELIINKTKSKRHRINQARTK